VLVVNFVDRADPQALGRFEREAKTASALNHPNIARLEDLTNAKAAAVIPKAVESAVSPSVYAYTRRNIRRNLYRIPLP
jgi:hypothetical protein